MSDKEIFHSRISDFMTVEVDHNLQVLSKEVLTTVKILKMTELLMQPMISRVSLNFQSFL